MKINVPHFGERGLLEIIGAVVAILVLGYGAYYAYGLYGDLQASKKELASRAAAYDEDIDRLNKKVTELEQVNADITATLTDEQMKNVDLESQKRRNEREISTLTKLTTIDPELLKKYSKVYFLSENYVPPALKDITTKYLIDPTKPLKILEDVAPHLQSLLRRANQEEVFLRVLSAYRSFSEQKDLKTGYRVQYGSGANAFSAEQGYSEHQLGTTVDFTTPTIKGAFTSFENTPAYAWLVANAYKYGFVLSYPKGNGYYTYEPWHWRFVGEELADYLHSQNKYFYELDQREIDEYLISIFD